MKVALLTALVALALPAAAPASTISGASGTLVIDAAGADSDRITVSVTGTTYQLRTLAGGTAITDGSAACTQVGDGVDCDASAFDTLRFNLLAGDDIVRRDTTGADALRFEIDGGDGVDELAGTPLSDVVDGGAGDDTINPGGGNDSVDGGSGQDTLNVRDGVLERVACGEGTDTAVADRHDTLDSCETADPTGNGDLEPDADRDGFNKRDGRGIPLDCDDNDPNVRPNVPETLGNGRDDNCDGVVDRNNDVDGDGFQPPVDCDDGKAAIFPTQREIIGNDVDENCDGIKEPFPSLIVRVASSWIPLKNGRTRLDSMVVDRLPADTRVSFECKGPKCPFKTKATTIKKAVRNYSLKRYLKRMQFRPNVKILLRFDRERMVGKLIRYKMFENGSPTAEVLCFTPGSTPRRNCA